MLKTQMTRNFYTPPATSAIFPQTSIKHYPPFLNDNQRKFAFKKIKCKCKSGCGAITLHSFNISEWWIFKLTPPLLAITYQINKYWVLNEYIFYFRGNWSINVIYNKKKQWNDRCIDNLLAIQFVFTLNLC